MTEDVEESASGSSVPDANSQHPRRNMEPLFVLGLFVVWIVLQVWILPKMGVRT
jgi:hypothetical protein